MKKLLLLIVLTLLPFMIFARGASLGDVNCSNSIDIAAALIISQLYVNLSTELPCQGTDPIPGATTFIQSHFGVTPYTFASPYGDNGYVSYTQSRFLLNRGVSGGSIGPNDSTNPFSLPGYIPPPSAPASTMNGVVDSARSAGKYLRVKVDGGTPKQNGNPFVWDSHGYYEIALETGSLTLSP